MLSACGAHRIPLGAPLRWPRRVVQASSSAAASPVAAEVPEGTELTLTQPDDWWVHCLSCSSLSAPKVSNFSPCS